MRAEQHMKSTPARQALYRFYGDGGQLLYVGITSNPGNRMAQHGATKSWWEDVRGVSIEWYDTRSAVAAAERRAIALEKPLHNVVRPTIRPASPVTVIPVPTPCRHCLNCREGLECDQYRPLEEDEDPPSSCGICGKRGCLYAVGYDTGAQHGWTDAYERYHPRFRQATD